MSCKTIRLTKTIVDNIADKNSLYDYANFDLKSNDVIGIYNAGILYEYGVCPKVLINYFGAIEYYFKGSELNDSFAINNIGAYYKYFSCPLNLEKAFEYYERATKYNNALAMVNIGDMYYHGQYVEKIYLKAFKYYERAAKYNNPLGYEGLASMYLSGHGIDKNIELAKYWNCKAIEFNCPQAFITRALMYQSNEYFTTDLNKAKELYLRGIKMGDSNCKLNLALLYLEEVEKKEDELYDLDLDDESSEFRKTMTDINEIKSEGLKMLNELCDINYTDAINEFAQYYHNKKNKKDMMHYYKKGVDLNSIRSLVEVGKLYFSGELFAKDHTKAMSYLMRAKNNSIACQYIGYIWYHRKEYVLAMEWYLKAYNAGNSHVAFDIATLYKDGCGVEQNIDTAKMWGTKIPEYSSIIEDPYNDINISEGYCKSVDWYTGYSNIIFDNEITIEI
jgi:TPR repeat protein